MGTRVIIPIEERRLLDSLPGDRATKESAWRYGCLYGRYQAMKAANDAVHDLPSVFGFHDDQPDELEQATAELQRGNVG